MELSAAVRVTIAISPEADATANHSNARCANARDDGLRLIAAAHVTAGLVVGVGALSARTRGLRVAIAFGLGVLSHVVLDAIPHSDYGSLPRSVLLMSVAIEIVATLVIAWYLLRDRRLPGLRYALPAGLAGAMIPDLKFARYFLPAQAGSWVERVGNRFHAPFHAGPTTVAIGLTNELICTLVLFGVLVLLVRRQDQLKRRAQESNL